MRAAPAAWPAGAEPTAAAEVYRVAGIEIRSHRSLPALDAFRCKGPRRLPDPAGPALRIEWGTAGGRVVPRAPEWSYEGEGWIGGRIRRLRLSADAAALVLDLAGAGRFILSRDGTSIIAPPRSSGAPEWEEEILLGPCLILALALRGIFCLHASAVHHPVVGVVAFAGLSGAGKSTLAAFLARRGAGWQRVSDDILPLVAGGCAAPDFPQLKLPPHRQPGASAPALLPIRAVFRVESLSPAAAAPEAISLSPLEATAALLHHGVASRIFPPALRARHLEFSAGLACALDCRRLEVPRRRSALGEVADLLEAHLFPDYTRSPG